MVVNSLNKIKEKLPGLLGYIMFYNNGLVAAKILGKKSIYIESNAWVYKKSVTGKMVYPIADLFFVQWPEMKEQYENAIYAGRLK